MTEMEVELKEINKMIRDFDKKGFSTNYISDGNHTFGDLYYHRSILFATICKMFPKRAWKSKLHDDGKMYKGYFIVGIFTPQGTFCYHYPLRIWDLFDVRVLDKAPVWDGTNDVKRLLSLG